MATTKAFEVVLSFTYIISGVETKDEAGKEALRLLKQKEIGDDDPAIAVTELSQRQ